MLQERDLRLFADRHLRRARRQHRAHPRREVLRAAAVDLLGRLVARQLSVGIDPALGLGAPLLSLGLRRGIPADQHSRLSDPQRAHAAFARLLLPQHRGEPAPARPRPMASATRATTRSTRRSPSSKVGSIKDVFDTGLHEFLDGFICRQQPAGRPGRPGLPVLLGEAMRLKITHRTEYRYDAADALCAAARSGWSRAAAPTQNVTLMDADDRRRARGGALLRPFRQRHAADQRRGRAAR